jgi:hypothetical protein
MLAHDVKEEVTTQPLATIKRRLWAALFFAVGEAFIKEGALSRPAESPVPSSASSCDLGELMLAGALLGMLLFALLGWRWSYPWRRQAPLASLAVLWLPLPYLLTHAEYLSGPRLPLDGILLCYTAFAVASFIPGLGAVLAHGPDESAAKKK